MARREGRNAPLPCFFTSPTLTVRIIIDLAFSLPCWCVRLDCQPNLKHDLKTTNPRFAAGAGEPVHGLVIHLHAGAIHFDGKW